MEWGQGRYANEDPEGFRLTSTYVVADMDRKP